LQIFRNRPAVSQHLLFQLVGIPYEFLQQQSLGFRRKHTDKENPNTRTTGFRLSFCFKNVQLLGDYPKDLLLLVTQA
jgi:hypothetical protein